jgi:hypothetical protein
LFVTAEARRPTGMTLRTATWLGVDFSGNNDQWKPTRMATTNVWIATVQSREGSFRLSGLQPVQALPGDDVPFNRLAALLRRGDFAAAGIDAPFSIPAEHLRGRTHGEILAEVANIPRGARYFPEGKAFVEAVTGRTPPLASPKPYRATDAFWIGRGLNVRSTLWAGARGGAPMTAASLTLLQHAGRPIWPFSTPCPGVIVEAFPAAQLRQWGLPAMKYDGVDGAPNRNAIVDALVRRGLHLGTFEAKMREKADATDAVLCAFAAIAVTENSIAVSPSLEAIGEGWIAVHC